MRHYEIMVIVDPDVDDRQVPGLIENHLKVITGGGGKVENIDLMDWPTTSRRSPRVSASW